MVTKYDIFELVYKHRAPMKSIDVVEKFRKGRKHYHAIHKHLNELAENGLLRKTKYGFEANTTEKAEALYGIIQYCIKNDVNYNYLLDKNLIEFISKAVQKKELTSKDIALHPRTFRKYIEILNKFGLVLFISKQPLRIKVFYNILVNNILVYFGYDHKIDDSSINYLTEIKKELAKFERLRRVNESLYKKVVSEFEISFVYHSLSLEGNPITLSDTIKILRDEIIPKNLRSFDVEEVKNYQEAILEMLQDTEEEKLLSLAAVLHYHKIAMRHVPRIAGKIRKGEVEIRGNPHFKTSKAKNLKKELDKLFEKYNDFIRKEKVTLQEIMEFAVFFHNEFQHIHPFVDGNSRTTRLITFHLLQSKGIPILDIPFGLLDEYLSYTKGSRKREDKKLFSNLQKIILFNLKNINERLG